MIYVLNQISLIYIISNVHYKITIILQQSSGIVLIKGWSSSSLLYHYYSSFTFLEVYPPSEGIKFEFDLIFDYPPIHS